MSKWIKLVISLLVPLLAGFVGSIFTTPSIPTWYVFLNKPVLNPPSWIFAPVWTLLHILMGVALYMVWLRLGKVLNAKLAIIAFIVQMFLNVLWSIIFFGSQNPQLAFFDICLLWFSIIWTIYLFYKVYHLAAYLLVPYIAWVSFAAYLNFAIWRLN